jgi:hypothetical protein
MAIQFASAILFRLSGRQWPGVCEQTVWPCQGESCGGGGDPIWSALSASDWHYGPSAPSIPYRTGDGWANCWDCGESVGSTLCGGGCYLPSVRIPGVVQDVSEVVVHGVRLPPSAYAVRDREIVRLDGGSWPCSNNLTGPYPYEDTTYTVTVDASGGSYSFIIDTPSGSLDVSLLASASSVGVRTALEGLVGAGNVAVSGGPGDVGGTNPYTITFSSLGLGYAAGVTVQSIDLVGTVTAVVVDEGYAPPSDSWYITYTYGKPVPPDGEFVASKFACEVALAMCGSEDCVLPARLKSIVREDVAMAFADPLEFIGKGQVGIYEVDMWLNSVNPSGLKRRSSIYRADAAPAAKKFRARP